MQVKNSKHFTARYELMVENAFFACKPPVAAGPRGKQRPPMHLYIRKLVWDDSTKEHSKAALRQLRALNWSAGS
jgi:regulator of nonsense transcripts 2